MTATMEAPTTELTLSIPETLAPDTRASLESVLRPIFDEAGPLCVKARSIVVTDTADRAGMLLAGETRKAIKKIRNAGEKKRKELKEDALRTGQAIDGIFRPFDRALTAHEEYLEQQETYAARIAAEQKAALKAERDATLIAMGVDVAFYNTAEMSEQAFADCMAGIEAQHRAAAEAKAKAEAERVAKEKADAEAREAQRIENERLRAEAAEREKQMADEREAARKEREALEAKARAEREAAEAVARKEREAVEKKARAERAAREQAERELREREEAEAKAKAKEEAALKRAARAPDAKKIKAIASALRSIEMPTCKDEEAQALVTSIAEQIEKLATRIEERASQF